MKKKKRSCDVDESHFYHPIAPWQIGDDPVGGVPDDVQELRDNTTAVLEGKVDINDFDEAYQKKMKNYYRFSATRYSSQYGKVARRTRNTLDII